MVAEITKKRTDSVLSTYPILNDSKKILKPDTDYVSVFDELKSKKNKKEEENVDKNATENPNNNVTITGGQIIIKDGDKSISISIEAIIAALGLNNPNIQKPEEKKSENDLKMKFDFDKNGKLDKNEKAAYEAYILAQSADINNDGEIDDFENKALEAYINSKSKRKPFPMNIFGFLSFPLLSVLGRNEEKDYLPQSPLV